MKLRSIKQLTTTQTQGSLGRKRREMIFTLSRRFGWRCWYCGLKLNPEGIGVQIDHIVPRCRGGIDDIGNYALTCEFCNRAKYDMDLAAYLDWVEWLRKGDSYTPYDVSVSDANLGLRIGAVQRKKARA